jgi:YecR-like lipoprotein
MKLTSARLLSLLVLTATVFVTGCAVEKKLIPTGGSRADGTVKLSFEYGAFEVPKLDTTQAMTQAQQRCAAWGYSGADPFGGGIKRCTFGNAYGCNRWLVTYEYQCTGNPLASK